MGYIRGVKISRFMKSDISLGYHFRARTESKIIFSRTDLFYCCLSCSPFVYAGCTDELQHLDQTINKHFKDGIKNEFSKWYSGKVKSKIKKTKKN